MVLILATVLLSGLPQSLSRYASGVGLVLLGLNAALACRYRALHSVDARRRSWTLFALSCVSAAAGNALLVLTGAQAERKDVSPSDLTLLVTLGLAAAAMVSFPLERRRGTEMVRMVLDGLVIGGSVLAVVSMRIAPSVAAVQPATLVVTLATPVIDITVGTLAILLLTRGGSADRLGLTGAVVAFSLFAVSDLLYAVDLARYNSFQLGTSQDLGWIVGYAVIALVVRHPASVRASIPASAREVSPVRGTATVFAIFLGSCLVGLPELLGNRVAEASMIIWSVALLAVLARQFFLVVDNEHLRQRLEERVVERTRSLRQVTRRSDLVVASVGDGIYGVDRFGLITFVNPAAAEVLGYEALELIGHDAYRTFHDPASRDPASPGDTSYLVEAISAGAMASAREDTYVRSDGRAIPVEVTATPLSDDGVTLGAVVVFRDVTQRREVDRLKNEFVSMVSHELRTPLTAIRGSLGLLAGGALGALSPAATRMVDIALVSSDRLTRLINEILDLERMDAGALPMELGRHPARELIEIALAQGGVLAQEAGIALRVIHVDGEVRADADRVVQTLLNLIGNAIKFSEPGQEVTVQAARRGSFVEFEVSDSGRGIPEDKLDVVFARFEQVDSSDAREKGGSGLGLAISRSIVERLGGRIWADNNPDGGAVFRFTLPVPDYQPVLEDQLPVLTRPVDDDKRRAQPVEATR